jgi:probable HAF family extracellular repeat protein
MLRARIQAGSIGLAISISGLLLLPANSAAQSFNFYAIDVPSSTSTTAFGINAGGDIVGTYNDSGGVQHGFLLSRGRFTTIDVPGWLVGAPGTLPTAARGINPGGDIVGSFTAPVSPAPATSPNYCPAAGSYYCVKGFLYSHGEFSLVLYPGHVGTIAQRITPTGDIYGCMHGVDMMSTMFGFGMTRFGDTSLQLNDGELADPTKSVPASMENGATPDQSVRVGLYVDMTTGFNHGYIVREGIFQTYDVPGPLQTNIYDINPAGDFVGIYIDSGGHRHGFLQPADGSAPISLTYPGAVHTRAYGINPGQAVVGHYIDTGGHTHGFLAVPAPGNR